jgi:predicted PurR-regulated permease PerM
MNAIPFLGPIIALIASLIYALIAEDLSPLIPGLTPDSIFFAVVAVVLITHFMDNLIFAPVILGSAVNLHPLVVILAIMGGSLTFGFAGLLLAIPAVVVTKVMTETLYRGLKAYSII